MTHVPKRTTARLLPGPCLLLCLALPGIAAGQAGVEASQQHLRDANAAREAGDLQSFTASLEKAHELNPASYYTRYNLARGYALTGRADAALDILERLVAARVDFGMVDDPRLDALRGLPRFAELTERLAALTAPQATARPYLSMPRLDLVPEGIAWDAARRRLFIGSMRTGEVFAVDRHRQVTKFATVEYDGKLAAIGMTVDPGRNLLWVIGSPFGLTEGDPADAPTVSGVFGFDLDTGELQRSAVRDTSDHEFNDVTLAPNGDLYLSGTQLGRLPNGADAIESLALSEPVFGSNGIVVTPDGRHLVTASYPAGLAVVRLADGKTTFPDAPDNVPLYGIDGMYWHDGDLVAVQNGVRPWRLMRFALNADLTGIVEATTLEFGNPAAIPTTGAIVGNEIHYLGQGTAPGEAPSHLPAGLHPYLGPVVIMTAPLH
ncbi:MAG: SMP-30/gluconolactonase/LRE family protein [Woeseiaceae bacterium]|nr:SMP-30/gluconolactonase/LRE family protein [Woeseiaceae bacterium]